MGGAFMAQMGGAAMAKWVIVLGRYEKRWFSGEYSFRSLHDHGSFELSAPSCAVAKYTCSRILQQCTNIFSP